MSSNGSGPNGFAPPYSARNRRRQVQAPSQPETISGGWNNYYGDQNVVKGIDGVKVIQPSSRPVSSGITPEGGPYFKGGIRMVRPVQETNPLNLEKPRVESIRTYNHVYNASHESDFIYDDRATGEPLGKKHFEEMRSPHGSHFDGAARKKVIGENGMPVADRQVLNVYEHAECTSPMKTVPGDASTEPQSTGKKRFPIPEPQMDIFAPDTSYDYLMGSTERRDQVLYMKIRQGMAAIRARGDIPEVGQYLVAILKTFDSSRLSRRPNSGEESLTKENLTHACKRFGFELTAVEAERFFFHVRERYKQAAAGAGMVGASNLDTLSDSVPVNMIASALYAWGMEGAPRV